MILSITFLNAATSVLHTEYEYTAQCLLKHSSGVVMLIPTGLLYYTIERFSSFCCDNTHCSIQCRDQQTFFQCSYWRNTLFNCLINTPVKIKVPFSQKNQAIRDISITDVLGKQLVAACVITGATDGEIRNCMCSKAMAGHWNYMRRSLKVQPLQSFFFFFTLR